jgi:hypothetical protein
MFRLKSAPPTYILEKPLEALCPEEVTFVLINPPRDKG